MTRLPAKIADAIATYVDARLAANPGRLSKPLTGPLADQRTARNGDYRVLFRLTANPPTIWIIRVDHRAHVYRP